MTPLRQGVVALFGALALAAATPARERCVAVLGDAAMDVRCARAIVAAAGRHTGEATLLAALARLRAEPVAAQPLSPRLAALLRHESALYRGRDKVSVTRLRTPLLQTVVTLGASPLALATLHDVLGFLDDRADATLLASAARAAGHAGTQDGSAFVTSLLAVASLPIGSDLVLIDRRMPTACAGPVGDTAADGAPLGMSLGMGPGTRPDMSPGTTPDTTTPQREALLALGCIGGKHDPALAAAIRSSAAVAGEGADPHARWLGLRLADRLAAVPRDTQP